MYTYSQRAMPSLRTWAKSSWSRRPSSGDGKGSGRWSTASTQSRASRARSMLNLACACLKHEHKQEAHQFLFLKMSVKRCASSLREGRYVRKKNKVLSTEGRKFNNILLRFPSRVKSPFNVVCQEHPSDFD